MQIFYKMMMQMLILGCLNTMNNKSQERIADPCSGSAKYLYPLPSFRPNVTSVTGVEGSYFTEIRAALSKLGLEEGSLEPSIFPSEQPPRKYCGQPPSEYCGQPPREYYGQPPREYYGQPPSEYCGQSSMSPSSSFEKPPIKREIFLNAAVQLKQESGFRSPRRILTPKGSLLSLFIPDSRKTDRGGSGREDIVPLMDQALDAATKKEQCGTGLKPIKSEGDKSSDPIGRAFDFGQPSMPPARPSGQPPIKHDLNLTVQPTQKSGFFQPLSPILPPLYGSPIPCISDSEKGFVLGAGSADIVPLMDQALHAATKHNPLNLLSPHECNAEGMVTVLQSIFCFAEKAANKLLSSMQHEHPSIIKKNDRYFLLSASRTPLRRLFRRAKRGHGWSTKNRANYFLEEVSQICFLTFRQSSEKSYYSDTSAISTPRSGVQLPEEIFGTGAHQAPRACMPGLEGKFFHIGDPVPSMEENPYAAQDPCPHPLLSPKKCNKEAMVTVLHYVFPLLTEVEAEELLSSIEYGHPCIIKDNGRSFPISVCRDKVTYLLRESNEHIF